MFDTHFSVFYYLHMRLRDAVHRLVDEPQVGASPQKTTPDRGPCQGTTGSITVR